MDNKALKTDVFTNENVWTDSCEQPIDIEFTLPEYCPDISKIFKCKTATRIASKSLNDKSITVDGSVSITVLYCDTNNKLCSYEYQYPFNKVRETDIDTSGCDLFATAKTDYINCRAVSGRKVDIHGAATINLKLFCRKCKSVISDIDNCNIEARRSTAPATSPMGYAEKYVLIEEEITLSDGTFPIEKIIRYDAYPTVTDCKIITDKVMNKGEMAVNITYCAENNKNPQVVKTLIPFSQIVDIGGITENCQCETKTVLSFLDIKPKTNAAGECKSFMLNAKLLLCSQAYCDDAVPIICDAFSRRFEADIIRDKVTFTKMCDNIKERFHFKDVLTLNEGLTSVLDLWCDVQSVKPKFSDGKLIVYGVIIVSVVGVNENGETVFVEKPLDFEYAHSLNNVTEVLECQPEVCVVSCGYTINSPITLEIRADLALNAAVLEKQGIELITELKLNEQKIKPKHNNCALTVYYASGQESVWDIARLYNASVDEIMKINEIKGEYVSEGSMLLVPSI